MNRLIIVLVFVTITGSLPAQYEDDYISGSRNKTEGVKRGDNLIQIQTDRDSQTNFMEFGKHLVKFGFTFKSKDSDFMLLVTDPKQPKEGLHYNYALNVSFIDTLIIIRIKQSGMSIGAAVAFGDVEIIWSDWKYASSPGNIMNQSFQDFYPVLKAYGYPVIFSKE